MATTRERSLKRYAPRPNHQHSSLEAFEAQDVVEPGVHTIAAGESTVDLLLDENGDADTLLVFFPSAVTPEITWPFFQGADAAKTLGLSLLAISDPTIARSAKIRTGWTLGDDRYWLHHDMTRYIDAVSRGRRLLFVGASAGGFPALYYGSMYPDSITVAINPRTHLFAPPTHLQIDPSRQFGDVPVSAIPDLVPVRAGSPGNTVVYLQNSGDHRYFAGHMIPYLHRAEPGARIWTRMGHWGTGHKTPPKEFLHRVLGTLAGPKSFEHAVRALRLQPFSDVDELLMEQATISVSVHRNRRLTLEAREAGRAASPGQRPARTWSERLRLRRGQSWRNRLRRFRSSRS
ncbi:hypothetical protein [Citricoccus sp. GCM10030269]|uniref:hypothetical protein n=1 Tax=Citricoccus sp. GCM10030269 TaxID=3273388 RepID=UPI00360A03B8